MTWQKLLIYLKHLTKIGVKKQTRLKNGRRDYNR